MQFYQKWKQYVNEAKKDAKVLRNINIDFLKKEIDKDPEEEIRDYFARLQKLEREEPPVFPVELVNWIESLDDRYFPREGRKRFAKWLGNAISFEETNGPNQRPAAGQFQTLELYNNDVRYIVDYLNGEDPREIPSNLWDSEFSEVMELGRHWHERLAAGIINLDDLPSGKLNYVGKKAVFRFENGYSIVLVDPTAGSREYTREEGLRCGWVHDEEELQAFREYYKEKGKDPPRFTIRNEVNDLDIEGCVMGHCVGGYCAQVSSGAIAIYSLRSPKNYPHVTIEVKAGKKYTLGDDAPGVVLQIKGFGNEPPKEEYRPMIKQWLKSTNFEYRDTWDYLNILSEEEIMSMVTSGEASDRTINDLARSTKSPRILDFFVNAIAEPSQEAIKAMNNANRGSLMVSLANSKNLSEAQVLRIVETDLEIGVLTTNHSVETLFHATHPEFEETRPDGPVLSAAIWKNFREKLTQNVNEIKLGYLSAIVKYSDNEPTNKEIVNLVLNDEVLDALVKPREDAFVAGQPVGRSSDLYTDLLQNYLLQNKNPDRETLVRIYKFTRTLKGEIMAPSVRMDTYIAKSLSISPDVVEDMLSDKLDPPALSTKKNLILNPSVEEKHKYGLITKMMARGARATGHPIVKQLGRIIWREKHSVDVDHFKAMPRIFSKKFLLWCLDAGVFDGVIQDQPAVAPAGFERYAESREQVKREILNLFREPTEENSLDEQVKKYFSRQSPVGSFYKKELLWEVRYPNTLLEARVKDIKAKYPVLTDVGWITWAQDQITRELGPKGVSKYLFYWAREMDRQFVGDTAEDFREGQQDALAEARNVLDLIMHFHENQHKLEEKDIYKYSIGELQKSMDDLGVTASAIAATAKASKEMAERDSEVVYTDHGITAVRPLTTQASCYFGHNPRLTKWCISEKEKRNYFKQYTEREGKAFVITRFFGIPEGEDNHIIALEFDGEGDLTMFHDAPNEPQNPDDLWDVILAHLQGMKEYQDTEEEKLKLLRRKVHSNLLRESKKLILANPPASPYDAAVKECAEIERQANDSFRNYIEVNHEVEPDSAFSDGRASVVYGANIEMLFDPTEKEYANLQNLSYEEARNIEGALRERFQDGGIGDVASVSFEFDPDNLIRLRLRVYDEEADFDVEGFRHFCAFTMAVLDRDHDSLEGVIETYFLEKGYKQKPDDAEPAEIEEQVNAYFKKSITNKEAFYKETEKSLVNEEKGRSRQRGIYKYYCMLSYGLTIEKEKTRGLDDILADLRALPNVTIVTVVVKNQKIAPGRYIAGLSIKFIPSIPGQFRSPEDVKSRILRDIRRLTNVQNIFKVSAGLERLE